MNKKLIASGMLFWASGTVGLLLCILIYKVVSDHCNSMGCIPAMVAMVGMIGFAPAPVLLILSILILNNQQWAVLPYNAIVTVLVIFMVLAFLSRIKADIRQRAVDRGVKKHLAEVEAANKATHQFVPDLTTYDAVVEIMGAEPAASQERYGEGLLVFYYNEPMCARMQRTQLEITFDSDSKRIIKYNCR